MNPAASMPWQRIVRTWWTCRAVKILNNTRGLLVGVAYEDGRCENLRVENPGAWSPYRIGSIFSKEVVVLKRVTNFAPLQKPQASDGLGGTDYF